MAGLRCAIQIAETSLSAATAKTVMQLVAPANQRLKVARVGVFFNGTSTTAQPVQVRVLRQTSAGTMSALTPVKLNNSDGETIQSTAQQNASAEPTASDVYDVWEIHPQSGYDVMYPLGQELVVKGGDRLGIECTAQATVSVRAKMWYEE